MTISTTISRVSYVGNSVTKLFAVPFRFLQNGDLEVRLIEASGASTVLTLTTDYTVNGADDDAGGDVTLTTAPLVGERLVIRRVVEATQETDYISGDPFPAESHERALDKLTMLVQQHDEEFSRTLQLPPESDAGASTINVEAVEVVAGIAADVSAVAAIDDEIEGVLYNLPAILDAPTQAGIATTQAGIATAQAGIATTQAGIATTQAGNAAASAALIALPLATTSGGSGANYANAAALFNGVKQAATLTATGVVELATTAEAIAGTDTSRAITPATLRNGLNASGSAPIYACRAWVNFNGTGTVAIRASGNVSSVTDNGVGDYTVNFTTAMPDANYVVVGMSSADSTGYGDVGAIAFRVRQSVAPTTTAVRITNGGGGASLLDAVYANVAIFR